jgi:hypothetical protein
MEIFSGMESKAKNSKVTHEHAKQQRTRRVYTSSDLQSVIHHVQLLVEIA